MQPLHSPCVGLYRSRIFLEQNIIMCTVKFSRGNCQRIFITLLQSAENLPLSALIYHLLCEPTAFLFLAEGFISRPGVVYVDAI